MIELIKICDSVCEIARKTGIFLRDEVNKIKSDDIESKGLHNFVTYVDKKAEEQIVFKLKQLIPEAGFIAEEGTESGKGERYNWVIDPLDGTTNFIHGLPCFSISIALMDYESVVIGVVYEINLDECFYAVKGGGAYLDGREIFVSNAKTIQDSLLATGFPYYDYSRLDNYMELFVYFLRNSHGVRRLGSAAVDLAYVACGRFEGFFEYSLNPWDVAAGSLIVEEAGGNVTDFKGGGDFIFGKEIVASNLNIFDEFIHRIKSAF
ncbi:MAG: inositol monophosphatase [Bacteroidetes bacterium]|nr:inositol monophosphatase [Bacteroidota bacterium]